MAFPPPQNMTGFIDMFQYVNQTGVTDGLFGVMFLISLYLVPLIFLLLKGYKFEAAGITAGFIVTIGCVFLMVAEIVTVPRYLFLCIATLLVPIVMVWIRDRSS